MSAAAKNCRCCDHPADGESFYTWSPAEQWEHRETFGLCSSCLNKLWMSKNYQAPDDADFTAFVIRRLKGDLNRHQAGRVVGRCEALDVAGSQCRCLAFKEVAGRRVCKTHSMREVSFACAEARSPYAHLAGLVATLAEAEPDFLSAITNRISQRTPAQPR